MNSPLPERGRAGDGELVLGASLVPPRQCVSRLDPDPVTTVTLLLTAIATAYQALSYHQPQPTKWFDRRRRKARAKALRSLSTDLLGLRAQFGGLENFLDTTTSTRFREFQLRLGVGSLVFRHASQMSEYVTLMTGLIKRYTSILRRTHKIILELEEDGLTLGQQFVETIVTAREKLNAALFESRNVGMSIDNAMEALALINDALLAAAEADEG